MPRSTSARIASLVYFIDIVVIPFQTQLFLHEWVDQPDQALQFTVLEFSSLDETACDAGRHRKQVRDVVAEVGHQNGGAFFHVHHVAHRVRRAADDVQFFAVLDDFVGR